MPRDWTIFSAHGHVLLHLARDPRATVRATAAAVGISPRRVNTILADLEAAGMIRRERVGRRNRYEIDPRAHLRHPSVDAHTVGDLLKSLT